MAYPRYAYLHPALPKAGDRQVAKTYFDDGAKAQKRKEWQRAKAAYLQASKSDPAWFEAQCELGQAAYYTGETGLALQAFENALAIDPNDGPARFNFAMSSDRVRRRTSHSMHVFVPSDASRIFTATVILKG